MRSEDEIKLTAQKVAVMTCSLRKRQGTLIHTVVQSAAPQKLEVDFISAPLLSFEFGSQNMRASIWVNLKKCA